MDSHGPLDRGSQQRPRSGAPTSWSLAVLWRPRHWLLPALRQSLHGPVWYDLGALYEPLY